MKKSAVFSNDRKYRYSLSRIWAKNKGSALFVCLNPSTANEHIDDPTITRCIRFAASWGYGGMVMVNLYAYRSTDPSKLAFTSNPIGVDNDLHIKRESRLAKITIAAWGTAGEHSMRVYQVIPLLKNIHYLALTKDCYPKHPLYLKKDLKPIPFKK
jgi:hypothetical protein